MKKIATHDSITGEISFPVLCWPLIPFARTQCKDLYEQYEAGCRVFDIRVRKVFGKWRGAHGLWFTLEDVESLLWYLYLSVKEDIYVFLTYEGKNNDEFKEFACEHIERYEKIFPKVHFGNVCCKYGKNAKGLNVKYDILIHKELPIKPAKQSFLPLDGHSWHTYLPIPWLWKQFFFKKVEFDSEQYQFVDFL